MIMEKSLPIVFKEMVAQVIATSGGNSIDWRLAEKDGNPELFIPKTNTDGFDVTIVADQSEISIYTEFVAHRHFTSDGDHASTCGEALGFLRDLLTQNMRIRVKTVEGSPYHATLEVLHEGVWHHDGSTVIFASPWFRKRAEHVYSNSRLPIREKVIQNS